MTLVESPPDFVQVHWEMDLDISSFSAYQFDLNVFNTTSQENTLFENIKGEYLCTWSAELSKSDLHKKKCKASAIVRFDKSDDLCITVSFQFLTVAKKIQLRIQASTVKGDILMKRYFCLYVQVKELSTFTTFLLELLKSPDMVQA